MRCVHAPSGDGRGVLILPAMPTTDLLAELEWRGMLYQSSDGLDAALRGGTLAAYCGFDPTAPSLHVGNLVAMMGLAHLQLNGHGAVALVGGGTGLIGDPSGKASERTLQSREQVEANVAGIQRQLERILGAATGRAPLVRNNAEWLVPLGALEFLRDVGKHFTVNYMTAKDSVKSRLEGGISFTEFAYMLLQAYDFLELFRRDGVTLQVGGSDQWGNMTAGIELIRRVEGAAAYVATFPLLTTAAGTKFGKSEGGAIWLDAEMTSPYRFYQFWIQADDRDVGQYLRLFTLLDRATVAELERSTLAAPERREAQGVLAREVTALVHGAGAARVAAAASAVLFGGADPASLDDETLTAVAREVPAVSVAAGDVTAVPDLFVRAGLTRSRGEARRLAEQGGAYVNGERVTAGTAVSALRLLAGGRLLLRKGSRDYAIVRIGGD